MQAFKFLDHSDVGKVLGGSFKFGRLRHYQLLEIVYDDEEIGDRNEGTSVSTASAKLDGSPEAETARMALAAAGGPMVAPGVGVTFENFQMISFEDAFVLSLSIGMPASLIGKYDGCIAITDVESLAATLWSHGEWNGCPLPDSFSEIRYQPITYDWTEHNLLQAGHPTPSAFRKAAKYAQQAEYRIALTPRGTIERSDVFITCDQPHLADMLTPVDVPAATSMPRPASRTEEENVRTIHRIKGVYQMLDEAQRIEEQDPIIKALSNEEALSCWEEIHQRYRALRADFAKAYKVILCRSIFEVEALRTPSIERKMIAGKGCELILNTLRDTNTLDVLFHKYGLK